MRKDKIRRQKIWWLLKNTSLIHLGPKWGSPSQSSWWQCSLDCCISNLISDLSFFLFCRLAWIKRHLKSLLREPFTTYLIIFPTLFPQTPHVEEPFSIMRKKMNGCPSKYFFFLSYISVNVTKLSSKRMQMVEIPIFAEIVLLSQRKSYSISRAYGEMW